MEAEAFRLPLVATPEEMGGSARAHSSPRPFLVTLSHTLTPEVQAEVSSRLDHYRALYAVMRKLQLFQNAAAQLLTGMRPCQNSTALLRSLH